jgi:hypothetical protein
MQARLMRAAAGVTLALLATAASAEWRVAQVGNTVVVANGKPTDPNVAKVVVGNSADKKSWNQAEGLAKDLNKAAGKGGGK